MPTPVGSIAWIGGIYCVCEGRSVCTIDNTVKEHDK